MSPDIIIAKRCGSWLLVSLLFNTGYEFCFQPSCLESHENTRDDGVILIEDTPYVTFKAPSSM